MKCLPRIKAKADQEITRGKKFAEMYFLGNGVIYNFKDISQ